MNPITNRETLLKMYDRYWDMEEIDVDLANLLVDSIPPLLNKIDNLNKNTTSKMAKKALAIYKEACEAHSITPSLEGFERFINTAIKTEDEVNGN